MADAKFVTAGRDYNVWVHREEDMLLIQRGNGAALRKGLVQGLTYGLVQGNDPYDAWKAAANGFVAPAGCKIEDLQPLMQQVSWQGRYTCPEGVDLRSLIVGQRTELRKGQPLRP